MKRCLSCHTAFHDTGWRCKACGFEPAVIDGINSFAPDLARSNSGFGDKAHERLDDLQQGSFWFRARNHLIVELMRRHFGGAGSFLEIGCGTGFVLGGIQEAFPHMMLTGSEIYVNGLARAANRVGRGVDLLQMDARSIPFVEEFDVIGAFDVLEHIEEDEAVLAGIANALKPGGGAILSVPQHPWLWSQADEVACHKRRYTRRELAGKCRGAGLTVERDTSFVSTLLPLMLLQRLKNRKSESYDPGAELVLPEWLDRTLELALRSEVKVIAAGLSLPAGGSRVVVCRKATG